MAQWLEHCATTGRIVWILTLSAFVDCLSKRDDVIQELRSSGFHLLSVPRIKPHAGTRAFSNAVPTLCNWLPEHVKSSNGIVSFRHHLKLAFSDFLFRLIICLWTLHCTWSTSFPNPCTSFAVINYYVSGLTCADLSWANHSLFYSSSTWITLPPSPVKSYSIWWHRHLTGKYTTSRHLIYNDLSTSDIKCPFLAKSATWHERWPGIGWWFRTDDLQFLVHRTNHWTISTCDEPRPPPQTPGLLMLRGVQLCSPKP